MTSRFSPHLSRRSMMRGLVGGVGVCVGIPTLDMFLNDERDGLRRTGAPAADPLRHLFLGPRPHRHARRRLALGPEDHGRGWEMTPELESLAPVKDKVSVFSGFRVIGDGRPNVVHWSGHASILSGIAPQRERSDGRSFAGHQGGRRDRRRHPLQVARTDPHRQDGELFDPHRPQLRDARDHRRSRSTRGCSARASRTPTAPTGSRIRASC